MTDLGVAASVLEQRRYGYQFGDAVTGLAGEIVLARTTMAVWLYFPKITGQPYTFVTDLSRDAAARKAQLTERCNLK